MVIATMEIQDSKYLGAMKLGKHLSIFGNGYRLMHPLELESTSVCRALIQ